MPGMFDFLMSDDPRQQAYNAMAFGLLANKGNFGQAFGQAGMNAMEVGQQAKQAAFNRKLLEAKVADEQAQAQLRQIEAARKMKLMDMVQKALGAQSTGEGPSALSLANDATLQATGGAPLATTASADVQSRMMPAAQQQAASRPASQVPSLNPLAVAMDLMSNDGKKIGEWINDRTKPDWVMVDTGSGIKLVNRNDLNAPREWKKEPTPGEAASDQWRRFTFSNLSAEQQQRLALDQQNAAREASVANYNTGIPMQSMSGGATPAQVGQPPMPSGTLQSGDPLLMQKIIADAQKSGINKALFNVGGMRGEMNVPQGQEQAASASSGQSEAAPLEAMAARTSPERPVVSMVSPKERQTLLVEEPKAKSVVEAGLQVTERIKNIANELKDHKGLSSIVGRINQYEQLDWRDDTVNARALQRALVNQIGIQALNDMRQMSKSGGAVGQVTEKEWPILQQSIAALMEAQTPGAYRDALRNVIKQVDESQSRIRAIYENTYGGKLDYKPAPHISQDGTKASGSVGSGGGLTPAEQQELEQLRKRFGK